MGKLYIEVETSMNSAQPLELFERLGSTRNDPLLIYKNQTFLGRDIERLIDSWTLRLKASGVVAGNVCAFRGDYSPEVCALLLALIKLKTITVPLTPLVSTEVKELLDLSSAEWFIDSVSSAETTIRRVNGRSSHELYKRLRISDSPGLVVFSSGSTGKPKGIVHDFNKVLQRFQKLRPSFRTLQFLMLDHFGGINTLLGALANGGVVVVAEDRSPAAIARLIENASVELLPVTPTFLNIFLATKAHRLHSMESLKVISYGTEVMPESTLIKVRKAFPNARLQQTYGLSEVGVLRSASKTPDSVWVKIGGEGFEYKIEGGVLFVRSDYAMLGYINAANPFDKDGWFCTHDQVEQDGDWLKIIGRATDLINVGGQKVFPAEVESVILEDHNVLDVSVIGEKHPLMGQVVSASVVLKSPEDPHLLRERLRAICKNKLAAFKVPIRFMPVTELSHSARFKKVRV